MEATSSDSLRSRRALIAAGLGGLAATTAHALGRPLPARAGHDATNVLHLGENNQVQAGARTFVVMDIDNSAAFQVQNLNSADDAGTLRVMGSGRQPVMTVEDDASAGGPGFVAAIRGVSSGPGFGEAGQFGEGNGIGVAGTTRSGTGVAGDSREGVGVGGRSESGAGVFGHSQSGEGVVGHSETGVGGGFSTDGGSNACHIGGGATSFALGVDNSNTGEEAGGILANSRGGKPTIEGDAFPSDFGPGVGVSGVAYSGTSYEDGQYGEGPGSGVEGISGDGGGIVGRSQRGSGVIGFAGGGDTPPPYGVPGLGHLGAAGFAPLGDDPFGIGALGTGQVGVHGFGGLFGVDGRAENAIAGNFVNYADSEAGAGIRAISPGDRPAVIAWSGRWSNSEEDIMPPAAIESDGGVALEVLGKARFSTAGAGAVPQGSNSVTVANEAVTALSHITVTLVGNPGPRLLRWIERSPGVGFTVQFSGGPPGQRPEVPFTYLIVEPV